MFKSFVIFLFLALTLIARENPFIALQSKKDIGKATSIKQTRTFFLDQTIDLPSTARILKSMELHYQNLDGSIESKTIKIDKNIDWHDTLVLQKLQKAQTTQSMNPPMMSQESVEKEKLQTVAFMKRLKVTFMSNEIKIETKDRKIRDFLVTNPYKIVLDFHSNISFRTQKHSLSIAPFENVIFGNHDGYYRVVIELDGQYIYTIEKNKDILVIHLK